MQVELREEEREGGERISPLTVEGNFQWQHTVRTYYVQTAGKSEEKPVLTQVWLSFLSPPLTSPALPVTR